MSQESAQPQLTALKRRVIAEIEGSQGDAIKLLQDLIQIPSVNPPGDEKPVADLCAAYLRDLGLEVAQIEPVNKRVSNVARLRGSVGHPTLLFTSHTDTFPTGDEANWSYPPFAAEIHDGSIWGIGAKNMKSGLAAAMVAVSAIRACGVDLSGDVLLSQVVDDIVLGDLGLHELVRRDMLHADFAVYTETDPPAKVEISHRGLVFIELTTHGLSKHTKLKGKTTPQGPVVNAILKMLTVVEAIERMEFSEWKPDPHIPGPPVISVNMIHGGHHRNMTADICTATADCRFLPCQTPEMVMRDVDRVLHELREADSDLRVEARMQHSALASEISVDEPIVHALLRAIREATGREVAVGGVSSTSDARWLVLDAGIPTAKFQFQDSESGANEHIAINDYLDTIKTYAVLIVNLLA